MSFYNGQYSCLVFLNSIFLIIESILVTLTIQTEAILFFKKRRWKAPRAEIASHVHRQTPPRLTELVVTRIVITYRRKNLTCCICRNPTLLYVPCLWNVWCWALNILNKIKILLKVFVAEFPERICHLRSALCSSTPQR